jgi:predicted XRE-type DNA-binding protein
MKKRTIDGIDIEFGSSNVFADLDPANAEKLKIKSGLVIEITKAIRRLKLSQVEAAERRYRRC